MAEVSRDDDCIFCKIIDKKLPATIVSDGDDFTAVRDIHPQAPTHILVMPNTHVRNIVEFHDTNALGRLFQTAAKIARAEKLESFRIVINTGPESGQSVYHLHIHVIGGRPMRWPPG